MREPGKSKKSTWWRQPSRLGGNLLKDEAGGVLVYMTVLIPVMMGVIGLAVDGSRLYILNTELHDLADAAALAGARELDRTDAGLQAARDAARDLVTNDSRWANDPDPNVHIVEPVLFCERLTPPDPVRDCDPATYTTDGAKANFIRVTAQPRSTAPSFIAAVAIFTGQAAPWLQTSAVAVAGTSYVACNVTPMMMCNTFNEADFVEGVMFELKGDNKLGPGAFSLVDPPNMTSSGNDITRRLLASTAPNFCYVNDVTVAPGARTAAVQQGLNVRFDLYPSGEVGDQLLVYPPAPNVTKGQVFSQSGQSKNCNFSAPSGSNQLIPFPRDYCFSVTDKTDPDYCTTYPDTNSRIGDGNWARDVYWAANHSGKAKPGNWNTITRYEAYLWELSNPSNMPYHAEAQENPVPQCHALKTGAGGEVGDLDRRSLYVAVTDCSGITGNSTPPLESARYGEFFLVRPSENGEILAEFVRWIEPDDDTGILRRIIQLYR